MTPLPGVLADLAELAGEDAALAIAREHGGTQVHIPLEPQPGHWLSQLVGHPEATTVAAALACRMGLRINVPFGPIAKQADAAPGQFINTGSAVLDEIAEVIGEQATFTLAEEFIGERVYIPKYPDTEPRIARTIGRELAQYLCDTLWRTIVQFPSTIILERRVADLAAQGMKKQEIARRLKIRQARVFAILKRQSEEAAGLRAE